MRRRVAERMGAPGADFYSLLEAIGRDCVGAMQFLPGGSETGTPDAQGEPVSEPKSSDCLRRIAAKALGIPPTRKYQSDGGPSMRDILGLLKGADDPRADQLAFFKSQILFWLMGATDGHAKNFSIFLKPGGRFSPTPFHDGRRCPAGGRARRPRSGPGTARRRPR